MKVYRYMSRAEFLALVEGQTLVNHRTFPEFNTASHGFCFMACASRQEAVENLEFLYGIVCDDVLAEFEVRDTGLLEESWGVYVGDEIRTEFCTDFYDKWSLKLTGYTHVELMEDAVWKEIR